MTALSTEPGVYQFTARSIAGEPQSLAEYRERVCLIVNTASECGFTPQLGGLEALYRKYRDLGFAVLGFPCDQFGHQEPGDEAAILSFCTRNYGVTFPMFAKIEVRGPAAHPLFAYLVSQRRGLFGSRAIKWNFTKFLVGRDGTVRKRYGPSERPERLERDIARLLGAG